MPDRFGQGGVAAAAVNARRVPPPTLEDFDADYGDCFAIAAGSEAPRPIELARRSLRGADALGGVFRTLVWHELLGFDLAPRGAGGTVSGWQVDADTASECVLSVDGSRIAGCMVFRRTRDQLLWSTHLRFHSSAGRRIWAVAGHVHRRVAPRSLAIAARG